MNGVDFMLWLALTLTHASCFIAGRALLFGKLSQEWGKISKEWNDIRAEYIELEKLYERR